MSGGGGTTTSNTSTQVPPDVLAEYNKVVARANQVADQPLNQYEGPIVAGQTPDELAAYNTINNMQGITAPYTQQASNLVGQSTQNINPNTVSASDIQNYQSPYTADVLKTAMAAQNNQDAQQQEQLKGNAISSGAWGGDRSGVAQGILGGQQAFANNATNAGIINQGYTQALQEANIQQQAKTAAQQASQALQANGATSINNIGTSALNNGLTGASAQLTAGQLQQQQAQAQLNAPYQQFLQSQAYPFQTTGWLGNIAEGIGSNEGGSSTTSSSQPSQGLFGLKRGGGIVPKNFDSGGATSAPAAAPVQTFSLNPNTQSYYEDPAGIYSSSSYVPITPSNLMIGTPFINLTSPSTPAAESASSSGSAGEGFSLAPTYKEFIERGGDNSGKPYTGGKVAGINAAGQADLDTIYGKKLRSGGIVPQHFDMGGGSNPDDIMSAIAQVESGNNPDAVSPKGAFSAYGIMPATAADPGYGVTPYKGSGDEQRFATDYHHAMLDHFGGDENMALMAYNGGPGRLDNVANGTSSVSDLPQETKDYPGKVMAANNNDYASGANDIPAPTQPVNAHDHPTNSEYMTEVPQKHEANPWLAVAAGVLGTLAGRSRNPLIDIGQGGLIGLNNYAQQVKDAQEQNYKEGTFHQNAQKLMDEADMQRNKFGEEKLRDADLSKYRQGELDIRRQAADQGKIATNLVTGKLYYTTGNKAGQLVDGASDDPNVVEYAANIGVPLKDYVGREDAKRSAAIISSATDTIGPSHDAIISLKRVQELLPLIDQGQMAKAERYGAQVLGESTPERAAYEELKKLEGNAALQNEVANGIKGRVLGFNMVKLGQDLFASPEMTKEAQMNILNKALFISETAKNANEVVQPFEGHSSGTLNQIKQKYWNDSVILGKAIPTEDYLSGKYKQPDYKSTSANASFQPRQIRLGNKVATVSTPQELEEAQREGWK